MRNDPATASKFAEAWAQGLTKAELATQFGMTVKAVDYWRRQLGLAPRPAYRPMPADFHEYASQPGIKLKDICRKYGSNGSTVNRWLTEAGIKFHTMKPVPDDWHERVGTMSGIKLAQHYGVANSVITRWLKETNTKPKRVKPKGRGFRLPVLPQAPVPKVEADEVSQAASYLRRYYSNVFRCDIMYDDRRTWGFVHGLPNGGRGLYHVDKVGILANNDVIELAKRKGWRSVELDS